LGRNEILEDVRSVWPSTSQSLENGYQVCNFYKRMFPSCSHVTDEHSCVMKIFDYRSLQEATDWKLEQLKLTQEQRETHSEMFGDLFETAFSEAYSGPP